MAGTHHLFEIILLADFPDFSWSASNRLKQELQTYSVIILFIKGVSPLNFHECRDICGIVRNGDLTTHDHPGGDWPITEHANSPFGYVLRDSPENSFGPYHGFLGWKQGYAYLRGPWNSWRPSLLYKTLIDLEAQSKYMFNLRGDPVNSPNGLVRY